MSNVDDAYPLTPSQLGILYDSLRDVDPELYFEQVRFDLVGEIDLDEMSLAWREIVARHPPLRTIWLWEGLDRPVQVVRTNVELPWTVLDWSDRDGAAARSDLDDLASADRRAGFDLRKAPVMRVLVVRLSHDRVHVVWSYHHIMMDGWSTSLIIDEVLDRLAGLQPADRRRSDPPTFRQYVEWLNRQDAQRAERFWRDHLRSFARATPLTGDRGPSTRRYEPGQRTAALGPPETARLASVAREHRVTLNTLVQAAWAVVVSCNSGDDDVVFGVTTSGRPSDLDGVEHIVGMFLATLPMRVRFDSSRTIAELWADLQALQLDLDQHRSSSLADITRWSDVPPGEPLFDSTLIFENYPRPDERERCFAVERRSVREQTRFPLTLMVGLAEQLEMSALYDGSRFSSDAVDLLLHQLANVLVRMAADPGSTLSLLSVMSDEERHRMLVEWNETDRPIPEGTVHAAVDRHAMAFPGSVALIVAGTTISYGELRQRSDRLAGRLRAMGVEPGSIVGVVHERSIDLVVALLAVMKCGAAYVAIEPGTPPERLRSIVEDAGITRALCGQASGTALAALDVEIIDEPSGHQEGNPDLQLPEVQSTAPMFVIFTSGSTGRPKGVPGSHRAVLNRCQWQFDTYPYGPDEVTCQKTTLNFVDHVAELWAPLVAGRPVVIIPDDIARVPDLFVSELARHRINRIVLVPSMLRLLLDEVPELGRRLPDLRLWMVSGEALSATLAQRLLDAVPGATLVNVYGMSEAMADVTAHEVGSSTDPSPVPIGRPLHNQRVYVVDGVGRPAPVGVPGQIWVSGPAVAPGCFRNGQLTDADLRVNPFAGDHGLVYVTGDVGRWRQDGVLEYLGRIDRQVKIRGVRVEPGEVEQAIGELAGVQDVVVVASRTGDQVDLVAFVVAGEDLEPTAVRRSLLGRLPAAFIPSVIQQVEKIPLLPSGKVDIEALRAAPRSARPEQDQVPFDDDVASMIALWEEVIGTDGIGPDDEFFDVGGHSMAAMRVLARVLREHDVNIPLATFYSSPTPRSLADQLHRSLSSAGESHRFRHLVPFTAVERPTAGTVFCVHGVGGNTLNLVELAGHLRPEWDLVGVQASGVDGIGPVHTSMDELCTAYLDEILAYGVEGPYFLAGYSSGGIFAIEMATRLVSGGHDVGGVALLDTFHPDVTGRARRPLRHLEAFLRQGRGYIRERRSAREAVRHFAELDELLAAHTSGDGVMAYELRERWVSTALRAILGGYSPPVYRGKVWLFAATSLDQRYEHVGMDRGWATSAPHLDIVPIPGGHDDFLREPNVNRVAMALRSRLDEAVRSRSIGSASGSSGQSSS
jgi:amino acid adenylation domain-containing protein